MDTVDYGKGMETKFIAWIDSITKKITRRGGLKKVNILTRPET